jgi:CRP/FNR family cyclic AMP-dependent transcriptional regulator
MAKRKLQLEKETPMAKRRGGTPPNVKPPPVEQNVLKPSAAASPAGDAGRARISATKIKLFDAGDFLGQVGLDGTIVEVKKGQVVFSQGDTADTVYYLQRGKIRLSVVSRGGKEATIALLAERDFLGEECLSNAQASRLATATSITDCVMARINRNQMLLALSKEHVLSDIFVAYLLSRNRRVQADLVDQLFNSSEKRLARALLMLAQFGKEGAPETVIPKISQEALAGMIGTTRSRVSFFMNRFRELGFIEYGEKLIVHNSLLNVVLHD